MAEVIETLVACFCENDIYMSGLFTIDTKKFTIRHLEKFSGIRTHTLRTWEQRYDLLSPQRSETNYRMYSIKEAKKILNIALLNKNGHKISFLSTLTDAEIENRIHQFTNDYNKIEVAIIDLIIKMYSMNAEGFEKVLEHCRRTWNIDIMLKEIIYPFLIKTELLWHGNRLSEEHFAIPVIRKNIILGIENAGDALNKDQYVLLFLSNQNQFDLALLYTHYLLKQNGTQVLYMGNDVSVDNIRVVLTQKKVDFLFTYFPQKNHFPLNQLTTLINECSPASKLIITTYPGTVAIPPLHNLSHMSFDEALAFLTQ
ncbi:MAG: MerR family transcriptional regulator [Chitinophagaceae bacterium]|nr:MerR family transcriptional regulator [Chitinophagaceae bacterium]